jgi:hypothetical protein
MMVMMMNLAARHEFCHRVLVASGMSLEFPATADALIRLNVRAGGNLLQKDLNRLRAFSALEAQEASGFVSHVEFLDQYS